MPQPDASIVDNRCDRCRAPAAYQVGKHLSAELREIAGAPHAVETRQLDLLFCDDCFKQLWQPLRADGWDLLRTG